MCQPEIYCRHVTFNQDPNNIVSYMTYLVNLVMAEDKAAEPFDLLEQTIEQFVETTRQIGIIVSDVQPGSQGVLNQKM